MIWLNRNGAVRPAGSRIASNVWLGGRSYDVWLREGSMRTITYTMTRPTTRVSGLDLQPLVADAVSRGAISESWYLISVEAGFELWRGGAGLATRSFSVTVSRG
jgi:hypothetical protein